MRDMALEETFAQHFDRAARTIFGNDNPQEHVGSIIVNTLEHPFHNFARDWVDALEDEDLFATLQLLDQLAPQELEFPAFSRVYCRHVRAIGRDGGMSLEPKDGVDGQEAAMWIPFDLDILRGPKTGEANLERSVKRRRVDIAPAKEAQRLGAEGPLCCAQFAIIAEIGR